MSDSQPQVRSGGISRVILLALLLIGYCAFVIYQPPGEGRPYVLGAVAFLGVVGIFSLFAMALGFLNFAPSEETGGGLEGRLLASAPDGHLVTDRLGRVLYANAAYAALTGAGEGEKAKSLEHYFAGDPAASEAVHRLIKAAGEGRGGFEDLRLGGGQEDDARWLRVEVRPLGDGKGERTGARMAWRVADISRDRERHEFAFQELQDAIDFLDHAPAGFFSAGPDGRIKYLNATLAGWLGRDIADFGNGELTLSDLIAGEGAALIEHMTPAAGQVAVERFDVDLRTVDGRTLPAELIHKVAFSADGTAGQSRTLVLDRSGRAGDTGDGADSLRAAEVRFARFFNNAPLAIATVNADGQVGRTNATFARLFGSEGVRPGKARSIADVVAEKDRAAITALVAAAAQGKADMPPADFALMHGEGRSARFYVSPVSDGDGEAAIFYAIDISDQKALEAQFAQSQKMQAVGQLAGGIAHDFNNVLTAIIGFSDLLLANHRPTDPSFDDIMNIKQNANRAAGLVRQLLAFSRRQTLRPQVLRLYSVMSELSVLLGRLLGEKVDLKLLPAKNLWLVKADHNQFEQVVMNLAVNARDAMPDGGTVTIRLANVPAAEAATLGRKEMPAEDFVCVEIADTGTGMSAETMEKIFDPFFTTKEIGKGTGLGLSTVYGIVKQTGGFIYPESAPGEGTTFRIYLPRHIPAESEVEAPAAAKAPARDLTGEGTILLVEDEDAVRAFAGRALAARGYTVLEASTGAQALEIMEEQGDSIDLVVSDVIMPEMDGPTLVGELRKARPDLRVVFVSGYAEDDFARNLAENEQFLFLPKPFSLKQLAETVKQALE
ncbi:MAG: cell cycle histidine kinase CckA [Flavobacteriaceae bacterium]